MGHVSRLPAEPEQIPDVAKAEGAHIVSPGRNKKCLYVKPCHFRNMPIRSRYRRGDVLN